MAENAVWPGGGWDTVRLLKRGGFGDVYEIQRKDFGRIRKAAMKVITIPRYEGNIETLRMRGLNREQILQFFKKEVHRHMDEINLFSRLRKVTNVVTYEDYMVVENPDEIGWLIFIRMELLRPGAEYFRTNPYTDETIIRLGIDICTALEACHKTNIVHRDIKLDNIFMDENNTFKLGDFGNAGTVDGMGPTLEIIGTPEFMAPEIFRGERYTKTSDLYSLGMVLYTLLNNIREPFLPVEGPFLPKDIEEANNLRKRGKAVPPPVNGSSRFKKIVQKALAFRPNDRYQSAGEFRRDLMLALQESKEGNRKNKIRKWFGQKKVS